MTRKQPIKNVEDQAQWETTESLIYSLAKQPLSVAPHRSYTIDGIIERCRNYVNAKVAPVNGMPTNRVGNPGSQRGTYSQKARK